MRVSLCEVSGVMVSQCEKRCCVRVAQCDGVLVLGDVSSHFWSHLVLLDMIHHESSHP